VNVSDEFGQISVALTKYGLMPSLKNMSYVLVSSIVITAVSAEDSLHYLSDRLGLAFKQQMNVVGHQTVSVEKERRADLLFEEKGEKLVSVFRRMKDLLAVVASGDQMIKPARNLNPKSPSHIVEII